MQRKWKGLAEFVTMECDGKDFTPVLREHKVHAIVFLNIPRLEKINLNEIMLNQIDLCISPKIYYKIQTIDCYLADMYLKKFIIIICTFYLNPTSLISYKVCNEKSSSIFIFAAMEVELTPGTSPEALLSPQLKMVSQKQQD